jgi:hypothetical protein
MVRIAVSGHRGLPPPVQQLIDEAIRAALEGQHDVIGLSCLADGADQIFARTVVERSGQIEAVIPATHYRDGLPPTLTPNTTGCWHRRPRCVPRLTKTTTPGPAAAGPGSLATGSRGPCAGLAPQRHGSAEAACFGYRSWRSRLGLWLVSCWA